MAPRTPFRRRTTARASASAAAAPVAANPVDDVDCDYCGSGDRPGELLLCDGCDRGLHLSCLRPIIARVPDGDWFCPSCCSNKKPKQFPLIQTKIVDFFRIQRAADSDPSPRKRKKRQTGLAVAKKKRRLLAYKPTEDPDRRMEQMASLATALLTTGAEFSNQLTYVDGLAPRSANRAEYERGGMQVLSKEDADALNSCKRMMERGECPPLLVVFDAREGFTVQADRFIRDFTIITEYVGDVDYMSSREHYDGDSMMTLISAKEPSRSLVICPDKHSNIARFVNGINNHTPNGKKKQNVKCVRYNVDGEARVLMIAIRDITKGERLYYDYNGYENEYPTQHFV